MKRQHDMPFGAVPTAGGGARFRLWAPGAQRVDLYQRRMAIGCTCGLVEI